MQITYNSTSFIFFLKNLLSLAGGESYEIRTMHDYVELKLGSDIDKQQIQNAIAKWLDIRRT